MCFLFIRNSATLEEGFKGEGEGAGAGGVGDDKPGYVGSDSDK